MSNPFIPNLFILEYLHEKGYEWNPITCANLAHFGISECLKYAHDNGCEWRKSTCDASAISGHLNCLVYAHENGCEWDKQTCNGAARNGHLNCLRYAYEHGCALDPSECLGACSRLNATALCVSDECFRYIKDIFERRSFDPHELDLPNGPQYDECNRLISSSDESDGSDF
jgi:hypothetical protein